MISLCSFGCILRILSNDQANECQESQCSHNNVPQIQMKDSQELDLSDLFGPKIMALLQQVEEIKKKLLGFALNCSMDLIMNLQDTGS